MISEFASLVSIATVLAGSSYGAGIVPLNRRMGMGSTNVHRTSGSVTADWTEICGLASSRFRVGSHCPGAYMFNPRVNLHSQREYSRGVKYRRQSIACSRRYWTFPTPT